MTDMLETAKRALGLVDLTNLNDDCTATDITVLSARSVTDHGAVAAVCVWPRFVAQASKELAGTGVKVATVVNFPAGGEDTLGTIAETSKALEDGADEIDLVMPYNAFKAGRRGFAEEQIVQVRAQIPDDALLKVILETGELADPLLIHEASNLAISAGADFIKTSTGKVQVNATLEAAEIMMNAIEATSHEAAARRVGFKPAGGIRTTGDAASYLAIADRIMGHNWVSSSTFRFGASGLLDALIATIENRETVEGQGY